MNTDVALNIAKRFIMLPAEKRKLYLEKMYAENISPANLPVPETRALHDRIPLSFAQQRQWFLWQLNPASPAYNIPTALRLSGVLDQDALRYSFQTLIERHEVLRTTFKQDDDQSIQIIHAAQPFALSTAYLAEAQTVEAWVEREISHPFDLEKGPLLRVGLLVLAENEHVLLLTVHHIISDGWSMPVMVEELVTLYESYSQGRGQACLPVLPIQYADYAIWQRNWMEAGEQERQLTYWKAQLGGEQPVLELPTDRVRPSVPDQRGARLDITLEHELVNGLKGLAQRENGTLFMVLLAGFQSILQRYSGQNDIRIGVPIANRTRVETEQLIGFFVNTQVLKATFDFTTTFGELVRQTRQAVLDAQTYQELPFEQLVEALQPDRSLSHSPLFQVMYNHQTHVKSTASSLQGLQVESIEWDDPTTKFDLTLNTFEHETGVKASLTYATALFDRPTIEQLAKHWKRLLQRVLTVPETPLIELSLLDEEEQQQIVLAWNRTDACYPAGQAFHQLFEQQVDKTPGSTALMFGEQSLSYTELNQRANRLARRLRELGVGPDVLVGIVVERSLEMVVGLLGVLKAGGAYVPLDPEYPQERLAYMLEHSGAQLLLTQVRLLEQLPVSDIKTLCLDRDWQQLDGYSSDNLAIAVHPEQVAYCIYTSGSTGKPKGVTVRHQALVNFLFSMAQQPGLNNQDRVLALTSLSFDIAGLELYLPLLVGASVVLLADRENQDPQALLKLIEQREVTTVQATPSTWRMLLDAAPPQALRNCRLLSGGEALAPDLASRLLERSEQVWNLYGPTETTIWSGLHCLDRQAPAALLGKPIANTRLHVVEPGLSAAPVGVSGELLIGGDGLARGYLHRPDLTAERFVPDPFDTSEQGGGRAYRTGDLARYHADGILEYVGRIDHQVKIRGFRIELGEIEARLLEHKAVREVAVIDIDGPSGKQLAAYLCPGDQSVLTDEVLLKKLVDNLRVHTRATLPDYMQPAHIVCVDKLPLTPNGKLDRKALSKVVIRRGESPLLRTRLERQLASIWQDVLKIETVGLQDNFFDIGGHSILMLAVLKRIREEINSEFSLHEFMRSPTLEKQAEYLRDQMDGCQSSLVKLSTDETADIAIYCLPPAGGTTFPYYPLARKLNGICSVYALLHKGFIEKGFHYESWEAMVQHYLDEIVLSQPEGPYHLLGWSSGGALAIEIAHRLEAKGERVNLLALIDSMLPTARTCDEASDNSREERPVNLADLNERNMAAIIMIRGFFPEKNDASISEKVMEGRAKGLQDDALVAFLIKELSASRGDDPDVFNVLYDAYAREAEFAVGYDIYGNIARLSSEFELRPLNVRPEAWWSTASGRDVEAIEYLFEEQCAKKGFSFSGRLDIAHERLVYSDEFLDVLGARIKAYI